MYRAFGPTGKGAVAPKGCGTPVKSVKKIIRSVQAFGRELSRLSGGPESAPSTPGIGIALGGGFARGIAHVGVLRVLKKKKFPSILLRGPVWAR